MDKASAARIVESTLSLSRPLDDMLKSIETISEIDERNRLRNVVGEVMKILTTEIVFPIARQFPELDSDR